MKGKHIDTFLGYMGSTISEVQNREGWRLASCPLAKSRHSHGVDKHPSFGVKEEINGLSHFHCFSCATSGDLMDIIILVKLESKYELEGLHIDKALQMLAVEEDELSLDEFEFSEQVSTQKKTIEYFSDSYCSSFKSVHFFEKGMEYLKGRGLSEETIDKFNIRYDSLVDRVVFPIRDWSGKIAGMHGRFIYGDYKNPYYAYKDGNRYNGIVWYGENHIDPNQPVILVESVFDMFRIFEYYGNVMCSLSAGIGKKKAERIGIISNLITIADTGKGGKAWRKTLDKYLPNHNIQHIDLTIYDSKAGDPGEMTEEAILELLEGEFLI